MPGKPAISRRPRAIGLLCLSATLLLALTVPNAVAKTVSTYSKTGEFDGTGASAGPFKKGLSQLAIDQATGNVLTLNRETGANVSQFTPAGTPVLFPALGASSIPVEALGDATLAVDNTGLATNGNIYVTSDSKPVRGFSADGTELGGSFPLSDQSLTHSCGVSVDPEGDLWRGDTSENEFVEFDPNGIPTGNRFFTPHPCQAAIDGNGNFYIIQQDRTTRFRAEQTVRKYDPNGNYLFDLNKAMSTAIAVDRTTNHVFVDVNVAYTQTHIAEYDESGNYLTSLGANELEVPLTESEGTSLGVAVNETTHDVYASIGGGCCSSHVVLRYSPTGTITVPTVTTNPADVTLSSGTMKGVVNADGVPTSTCIFEWTASVGEGYRGVYENAKPCDQGMVISGSSDTPVTATLNGLVKGTTYYYRLSSENANGVVSYGTERVFRPQGPPSIDNVLVTEVRSDQGKVIFDVDPNGGLTHFNVEWGETAAYGHRIPIRDKVFGSTITAGTGSQVLTGLKPGTEYHFKVVLANDIASVVDTDHVFKTYPADAVGVDPCGNSQVRKQTGAARLSDCRAYELVSASNTGGYDVQSDLIPGQSPLRASPYAQDQVLYSMRDGAIPDVAGQPTNLGLDPYVATRGQSGWLTSYLGVPGDNPYANGPFSSTPSDVDMNLRTFAFGSAGGCSPCFADGTTGIPVRLPNGNLVQGMVASPNVADPGPTAKPDGYIARQLSENGTHLIFGSTSKFAPGGNDSTGDVSIYDRNLETGVIQTVSLAPSGNSLECLLGAGTCHSPGAGDGIGELDISQDGSRVLIGQKTSSDAAGNRLWHLYMHIGNSSTGIDLMEGAITGAIFDGMSADGTRVFYTMPEELLGTDTDSSADIYEAHVDGSGSVDLRLLTTKGGTPSNDDSCAPPGEPDSWNVPTGPGNCDAVAYSGGAGVGADGTIYFLSPEQLDGAEGTMNQANLYRVEPAGDPKFVATIDSSVGKPGPQPPTYPLVKAIFVTGLSNPEGLAVDQDNGDLYVVEKGTNQIARFTSAGAAKNFTQGPGAGSNLLPSPGVGSDAEAQIGIDNSGGPLNGSIYVRAGVGAVNVYSNTGLPLGSLTGFAEVCGIAVDQNTGELFVGDYSFGGIRRFKPTSGTTPVSKANYEETGLHTEGQSPCHVGADSAGHAFAVSYATGSLRKYNTSDFAAAPPTLAGSEVSSVSYALSSDPSTGDLYNDEGGQIVRYDSAGNELGKIGSPAELGGESRGVAIDGSTHRIYALRGSNVLFYQQHETPYEPIDNSGVVHGVHDASLRTNEDIQVSPDGRYAVFPSSQSLTGYANRGHSELYRYDAETAQLDCASCAPTGAAALFDTTLSAQGRNLTEDGGLFYTSSESLVLRDTNNAKDVYEWEEGTPNLISTGSSQFDSGLLSATADGKDTFFFTRQVLAPQDGNGAVLKIYDAREGGGFFVSPPPVPCQASDECHGPGTEAAPSPQIGTYKGIGGNVVKAKAKKKRKKHKRRHRKHRRSHSGKSRHG